MKQAATRVIMRPSAMHFRHNILVQKQVARAEHKVYTYKS